MENLNNKLFGKHMPPPWMAFPNIPLGSIGWRMGYGEYYNDEYNKWKNSLSENDLLEHNTLFPVPKCWSLEKDNIVCRGAFWTYKWTESGYPVNTNCSNAQSFVFFWGHHSNKQEVDKSCLSQWYISDFKINIYKYCCMEQYMMQKKALLFGDENISAQIMKTEEQKRNKISWSSGA